MKALVEEGGVVRTPFPVGTEVEIVLPLPPRLSPEEGLATRRRLLDELRERKRTHPEEFLDRAAFDALLAENRAAWGDE